ncbi:nucleotide pyrophosphatase/phosphodiesterase family protein [Actinopolymorpha sp. B11F2]|uniref:alkaline phosphatase family protein n=1 Tax=Actinopolymorpha sp. B11F2 TaxID=3160862 RepID=UPI0032E47066
MLVLPKYGEAALSDLVAAAMAGLEVESARNLLGLPPARRYVVLLIDGFGWNLLRTYATEAPYLAGLADQSGRPLTAPVPSTTSTSLVSLGTGRPPGEHGVVGYTMLVPGTDHLLNTLRWNTTVEPLVWQPHATLLEQAERAGVAVTSVSPKAFRGSGLTVAGLRGGEFVAADSAGQRIAYTAEASARGQRSLVYLYEGSLDWTGHRDGCHSPAWRHQLAATDAFVARLRAALPADATLLITGDHGMLDVPFDRRVDVDSDPRLRAGVYLVGGDPRLRYLYTEPGATDDVVAAWRERLGPDAVVLTRDEAVTQGWFGPVDERVLPRLGDVVIASLGDVAVECAAEFPMEASLLGWHGSLTADEMLVPLLVAA